jgi:hypothetical protein
MTNDPIIKTLGILHDVLAPVSTDWMIIGSASLFLYGLPGNPHDIDILCDTETAKKFEHTLSSYRITQDLPKDNSQFASRFSRYTIHGMAVEIMGDLSVKSPEGWVNLLSVITDTVKITRDVRTFVIPGMADQLKIYTLFDRKKDRKILNHLKQRTSE